MDARTLRACAENQRNAAKWAASSRAYRDAPNAGWLCAMFAAADQATAARLSRADRLLRGLEG